MDKELLTGLWLFVAFLSGVGVYFVERDRLLRNEDYLNWKRRVKNETYVRIPFKERFADLSKAEVGDYVFANGVISKDPHAAKILTGIIGWINPDPHEPIGKRAYVITPETINAVWAKDWYKFGCTDLDDGWNNTYKLLEQAKSKGKKRSFRLLSIAPIIANVVSEPGKVS